MLRESTQRERSRFGGKPTAGVSCAVHSPIVEELRGMYDALKA